MAGRKHWAFQICVYWIFCTFSLFTGANRLVFFWRYGSWQMRREGVHILVSAPYAYGVRTTSPGVQFIYPKRGVRNLRQGILHQTCPRWCKYRTRSKVHIIRLTFTIIIARIPRQTILLGTRSITHLYRRHWECSRRLIPPSLSYLPNGDIIRSITKNGCFWWQSQALSNLSEGFFPNDDRHELMT